MLFRSGEEPAVLHAAERLECYAPRGLHLAALVVRGRRGRALLVHCATIPRSPAAPTHDGARYSAKLVRVPSSPASVNDSMRNRTAVRSSSCNSSFTNEGTV